MKGHTNTSAAIALISFRFALGKSMRTTAHDDVTRAVHSLQYAPRLSGLDIGYFARQPWYTKRRWRWTAIALLILALIAAQLTSTGVASW